MSAIEHSDIVDASLAAATYYYGVSGDSAIVHSIHMKWDATLVATITFESSNFDDVALGSTTAGDWVAETSLGTTSPAASASGAMIHVGNFGSKRLRMKVVVGTLGRLRAKTHGKH